MQTARFSVAGMLPHSRWMLARDLPEVIEIERRSFPAGDCWTEEEFIGAMRERNTIGLVAELDGEIAAFVIYQLYRHRLDLLNLAVDPWYRRHRLGTTLIDTLKRKTSQARRRAIEAIVVEDNLDAQLFFRSQGFRAEAVLRDYYDHTDRDGYLFRWAR